MLAVQVQKLQAVIAREGADVGGGEDHAAPGVGVARMRQAVELAMENAAGFQHAADLAHVFEHHIAAGDVLKDRVGIDELERVVRELRQAGAVGGVEMGVRNIGQPLARQADHFVGNIHAVDFAEVAAQRFDQTSGAASNFERPPSPAVGFSRQPLELSFE